MTPSRIMIVEDERITAEHLREILSELGYIVTAVASNGSEAIREAERTSPELVLMDVRIEGGMDGLTTAKIIRERLGIPSVYLTAHADHETISRAKDAEPLGYIVKPFQETELQASIEMALHKDQVDRRARAHEERLEATLGAIGEGIIAVDSAGAVTLLNSAAERWTGWKQQDALGKGIEEVVKLMDGSARLPVPNPLRRAARDGALTELEGHTVLISRHGSEHQVEGSAAPVRNHEGGLSGAVLVFGESTGAPKGAQFAAAQPPETPTPKTPFEIVFESEVMRQTISFARRVAASEASTILLQGESGTGKDVIAKYLHYNSRRDAGPFVAVNCAAIPGTLLESELFGYEKGAFTDARAQKKGILEVGHGGTVFLDEVGELPLLLQAKLLRVLEEQSFRRLGGVKDIQVDLRVISATNRSLSEEVAQGNFRIDLYYRLNVIQILVPPLRERKDDILPLANHFIGYYNQRFRRQIKGISPEAARALLLHEWPGNVRELRNTIERAMLLEESAWLQKATCAIGAAGQLATAVKGESVSSDSRFDGLSLEEAEKAMLVRALEKTGGNQTQAARMLNITRDTLRYKIKKFNLTSPGSSAS